MAKAITERVRAYVPGVSVELSPELSPPRAPSLSVDVLVRDQVGHASDVARQGHGIQRSLVIALLHELADRSAERGSQGTSTEHDCQTTPATLMLAIEEPELYQHPLQARSLAETLATLTTSSEDSSARSVQVAYSTHSPHFVRPAVFERLRVFRRGSAGHTEGVAADAALVATALRGAGIATNIDAVVRKTLADTLAEAIFARAVVLCEGTSDAALIAATARLSGGLDRHGIAVVASWGKTVIPVALAILKQLAIPTYVVFDGDAGLDVRLRAKTSITDEQREAQLGAVAQKNRQLLALCDEDEVDFPPRQVRAKCANFYDRLETDLEEIWPSLAATRTTVALELGISSKADEVYRRAVGRADTPPTFILELLEAVHSLVTLPA